MVILDSRMQAIAIESNEAAAMASVFRCFSMTSSFLKEIPGVQKGAPQREFFRLPAMSGGQIFPSLPRGALIELSGPLGAGKTEVVLKFLAANPEARVAWIEEKFTAYPCSFIQNGVSLERVLFIEAKDPLWSLHQTMKSQVFGAVIWSVESDQKLRDPVVLRRLQIAAERSSCSVLLLTETPAPASSWPISVQIRVSRHPRTGMPVSQVLKFRGIKSGEPPPSNQVVGA
jgi:hypothetical protein